MKNVKISNMQSPNGNQVPNQFILSVGNDTYFQSYHTIIARNHNGKITLDINRWNYSNTTGKYRNLFLGEDRKTTEKKIKSGEYKLVNLN